MPPVNTRSGSLPECFRQRACGYPALWFHRGSKAALCLGSTTLSTSITLPFWRRNRARRFMSNNPPFMGARYAAAHDFSRFWKPRFATARSVRLFLTRWCTELRKCAWTCRTVTYVAQNTNDQAQSFRFEDAGNSFSTSNARRLVPHCKFNRRHNHWRGRRDNDNRAQNRPECPPGITVLNNPDLQKWKFTSSAISAIHPADYTISCAAVHGKVLQPAGSSATVRSSRRAGGSGRSLTDRCCKSLERDLTPAPALWINAPLARTGFPEDRGTRTHACRVETHLDAPDSYPYSAEKLTEP